VTTGELVTVLGAWKGAAGGQSLDGAIRGLASHEACLEEPIGEYTLHAVETWAERPPRAPEVGAQGCLLKP
jgi:hypothetical protein